MEKIDVIKHQLDYWSKIYEHTLAYKRHDIKEIKAEYDFWKNKL